MSQRGFDDETNILRRLMPEFNHCEIYDIVVLLTNVWDILPVLLKVGPLLNLYQIVIDLL
jgi:hypothetical protein